MSLLVDFGGGKVVGFDLAGYEPVGALLASRFSGRERFHTSIHGFGHWVSVYDNAGRLLRLLPDRISARGAELALLAAILHDTGRLLPGGNDGADPRHAIASERFVRDELPGLDLGLDGDEVDSVALLCRLHCREEQAFEALLTERGLADALAVVRDADRLDRARLGDLDPTYFEMPDLSARLVDYAESKWRSWPRVLTG